MSRIETPKNWTPAIAHRFAMVRIERIKHALAEIGYLYGDVYQPVTDEADSLAFDGLNDLVDAINEARDQEAQL
ncbi:hypothetical protein C8N35_102113 [Breoghania corrubedonensis]|uniref:Rop-like protein n=1 Tax=Breoghania corrubedonensis TaxID=665038 RepID=A0A2T5VCD8_9HYPH|nr:hypothetical protein [Breoghania corrubedonensis]PTW61404.1 hypothetical protein C8N35_102113 [Breoghania corrubedonensis]